MSNIKKPSMISFVGVDSKTDIDMISDFKNKCEFSVLFSKSALSSKRYPSLMFCKSFLKDDRIKCDKSIHLCGASIFDFLMESKEIIDLCYLAKRIQLNFNSSKLNLYKDDIISDLMKVVRSHNFTIILQENKSKKEFNDKIREINIPNFHFLHDASGGLGKEMLSFEKPFVNFVTGYAGGINKSNVSDICKKLSDVADNLDFYIDMESGVRVDDYFSVQECKDIDNIIANM